MLLAPSQIASSSVGIDTITQIMTFANFEYSKKIMTCFAPLESRLEFDSLGWSHLISLCHQTRRQRAEVSFMLEAGYHYLP